MLRPGSASPVLAPGERAGWLTRDEAVQVGVESMAVWHDREHGLRCTCAEGERFGTRQRVDALIAQGAPFDAYTLPGLAVV